jgi:Nif-specific regulatory protein
MSPLAMSTSLAELRQRLQKDLSEMMAQLSSGFLELSMHFKQAGRSAEGAKNIDRLFRLLMESNRALSAELNSLLDQQENLEKRMEQLLEEKRKLEVLYSSGILFSSETEMASLMEIAIETVVRELKADAGFIILTDSTGEPTLVVSRNINPDEQPEARQMSMSVIRSVLATSTPAREDIENDEFLKQKSVVRLGIKAVLCVPLISRSSVMGAVYLDRRNKEHPFTEADLVFLLSFARQIVRGIEVSSEISTLERKLMTNTTMKLEDLRREFIADEIVGSSRKLFEVLKVAARVAATDAPVLLLGENGTGKDLLANAIHRNSRRKEKPFVTINCGAIPSDLLESELFGFESGAFTGAMKSKMGRLELANGGTLFLDEIGEMSTNLQAKLLRVIQTKEIERLGSISSRKIDTRIIAATNRDLRAMIEKGQFREDLYYRLKVIEITLPSLRERREDIAELANYFLKKHARHQPMTISSEALDALEQYSWPGNVRELENIIQRGIVLAKSNTIDVGDLPPEILERQDNEPYVKVGATLLDAETEFRRLYVIRTLRQTKSKAEAAQMLGINRTHFYRLLAQLGIDL